MSSLFVEERVFIPGKAEAVLRNKGSDFALTDNNEGENGICDWFLLGCMTKWVGVYEAIMLGYRLMD
ncbi:hypothetical protein MTR_6g086525 [Medicago truncatula]|uniref:Uncharacterized protein n=1 Tax=Medicago truncatula TaxID=3880 RepID=A0A072UDD0_MEDTR|nr:hypothetical protein MTR_6g086525 [Medicago truncatula]